MAGAMPSRYVLPGLDVLGPIECQRLEGESTYDAAKRLLTHQLLAIHGGRQDLAAKRAGVSTRVMNLHAQRYGLRPVDQGEA